MKRPPEHVESGYRAAAAITRHRAKSFAFASLALDRETRRAAFAVYAFCRRCDDAVDASGGDRKVLASRVRRLRDELDDAYAGDDRGDAILAAFSLTVLERDVPKEAFSELIDGMEQDLTVTRYETWDDVLHYCELAAGTVGRMMAAVFGVSDRSALVPAAALGRAMQLTNILRDVREDLEEHGRIYLPMEALRERNITEADLRHFAHRGGLDESRSAIAFRDLMREGAERANALYRTADAGIPMLTTLTGRSCVRLMRATYSDILHSLEALGWDPFMTRARTSTRRKVVIGARAVTLGAWI